MDNTEINIGTAAFAAYQSIPFDIWLRQQAEKLTEGKLINSEGVKIEDIPTDENGQPLFAPVYMKGGEIMDKEKETVPKVKIEVDRTELDEAIEKANELKSILEEVRELDNLKFLTTKELVNELEKRKGVEKITAEPYKYTKVITEGPAIILKIID